jgi:hypothetical protein
MKFHKGWFRFSKGDGGYKGTQTAWRSHKPALYLSKEGKLAICKEIRILDYYRT